MSAQEDDFENPQDEDGESSEDSTEESEESAGGAASTDKNGESGGTDDALSKLQSERDKAIARANKAEKALKATEKKPSANSQESPQAPPEVKEWITAAQENMRRALLAEHPEFSEYGIDANLITGETPAEMRASAKSLSEFVGNLQSKVRSSVLQEHGFDPEPKAAEATGRKSVTAMDEKEFNSLVENVLRG